ncbi:MAG: ABC transporter transmembrane domain-containing protein, partial [Elusimicrobiota bacterium]
MRGGVANTDAGNPSRPAKGRSKELAYALHGYVKPYKTRLLQAALSMTLLAAIRGGIVYILGPVMQGVFVDKDLSILRLVVIGLPALFVLRMAAEYTNAYLMSWVGQKAVQKIRDDLFTHIHRLSIEFYWRKRSSDVMSRVINDLNNVQSTVQFTPLYGIRDMLTVISCIGVLFYIHWKFALLSLVLLPATGVILGALGRKMRRAGADSAAIVGEISHKFQESLQGMTVVKAFNYEDQAIAKFRVSNDSYFSRMMRYLRATAISGPIMEFIGSIIFIAIIYLGGQAILSGTMTTAHFFSFVGGFFTAYMPLKNIANLNSKLQLGMASWERIYQILEEKPTVIVKAATGNIKHLDGRIEFKNVNY